MKVIFNSNNLLSEMLVSYSLLWRMYILLSCDEISKPWGYYSSTFHLGESQNSFLSEIDLGYIPETLMFGVRVGVQAETTSGNHCYSNFTPVFRKDPGCDKNPVESNSNFKELGAWFSFLIFLEYRTKLWKPSLELRRIETESAIARVRRLLDRSRWWFPW